MCIRTYIHIYIHTCIHQITSRQRKLRRQASGDPEEKHDISLESLSSLVNKNLQMREHLIQVCVYTLMYVCIYVRTYVCIYGERKT